MPLPLDPTTLSSSTKCITKKEPISKINYSYSEKEEPAEEKPSFLTTSKEPEQKKHTAKITVLNTPREAEIRNPEKVVKVYFTDKKRCL